MTDVHTSPAVIKLMMGPGTVVSIEPFLHGAGTLWCLQKEMATYRHWSMSLWRDPDDVPHCRILSRQNWMAAYLGYTLRMKTLFRGWPIMAHEMHTRRRNRQHNEKQWTVSPYTIQVYSKQQRQYHRPLTHSSFYSKGAGKCETPFNSRKEFCGKFSNNATNSYSNVWKITSTIFILYIHIIYAHQFSKLENVYLYPI